MSSETIFTIGFLAVVAAMLALDLGVVNRRSHVVGVREALAWTGVWVALGLLFCVFIYFRAEWIHGITTFEDIQHFNRLHAHGLVLDPAAPLEMGLQAYRQTMSVEYLTGYLIEKALSVDNIFVMIVIFTSFGVNPKYYHKVLFWGIIGAVMLRMIFIFASAALIERFEWVLWIFGALLVVMGIKTLLEKGEPEGPNVRRGRVVRWLSRNLRITRSDYEGRFFVRLRGRRWATPLFLVLLVIEGSDVIFAVDSIPAIFSVTRDPYIVFFSNIFAILGLRSLFFVLSGMMGRFVWLKPALGVLLTFIGVKMLLAGIFHIEIGTVTSLFVVLGILAAGVVASLLFPPHAKA